MKDISARVLSKLAYASVTDWTRIIQELEANRKPAFLSYKPARMAIVAVTEHPDQIAQVRERWVMQTRHRRNNALQHNLAAFDTYVGKFLSTAGSLTRDLMSCGKPNKPASIAGVPLVGGPHMETLDTRGRRRFVYLRPGQEWPKKEVAAFCELLCIVLEEQYGADPSELLFLDLYNGRRINYPRSRKLVRKRCIQTVQLLPQLLTSADFGHAA